MTASRFRLLHGVANTIPGLVVGGLILIHLHALIEWDPASLRTLAWSTLVATSLLVPLGHVLERRAQRDVVRQTRPHQTEFTTSATWCEPSKPKRAAPSPPSSAAPDIAPRWSCPASAS